MEGSTRTVYGGYIQTCLALGLPPSYPTGTTMNEELGINATTLPASDDTPKLAYWVIGNKGHDFVKGTNGIAKPETLQHKTTDSGLFGQIPFVLRPVGNDLSPVDRTKYALRREETWGSQVYAAYYARRIDLTNVTPQMQYNAVANGTTTTTQFVPTSSNLHPTPPALNNAGVNTVTGDYLTADALLNLTLTTDDATELQNVASIMFGDAAAAVISEIGMCFGVDHIVSVTSTGAGNFNMNEVIGTTIAMHIPALYPMTFADEGVTITLNLGSSDPLFALTNTGS